MPATRRSTVLSTVITVMAMLGMTGCQDEAPTDPTVTGIALKPGGGGGKGPKVESTDPTSAPQDTTLDVQVFGSSFDDGSEVTLTIDGIASDLVTTNLTTFVSPKKLIANITIDPNAIVDLYDVEVLPSRGRKGIGADLFSVTKKKGKPGEESNYTITDLGMLPGHTASRGSGINVNNDGVIQVVGYSFGGKDGSEPSTLWTVNGSSVNVHPLEMLEVEGTQYAWALAITETGIAVGQSGGLSGFAPVYWDANRFINLLPTEGASGGRANDVSLVGVDPDVLIVGKQRTSPTQAVYWVWGNNSFELRSLPIFEADMPASAQAVNSQGTIAGRSRGHAVVWHPVDGNYRVCDLGPNSTASGISEPTGGKVHVAGVYPTTDYFATVWTVDLVNTTWSSEGSECLATVRSLDFYSEFFDVNAQGDAVGEDIGKHKAILWPESNPLVYLPSLTSKGFSGANAISADGTHIAGRSAAKRSTRAVLWTRKD